MARIMPTIQGRKKVQKKALSSSKITKPPKSFGREPTPALIRVKKKTAKGRKSRTIKSVEIRARDGDSSQGGVQPTAQDEPQFRLFPKLPLEIRLKIWSLMAPSPQALVQSKPLEYRPRYTIFESRPTPVVMHVCRESRNEYLYRENDAANNVEGKSHSLYAPIFPNENAKLSFFSFEVDTLHLMTFRVAEPVVRNNLRTVIMGPSPHLSPLFKKLDDFSQPPNYNYLQYAVDSRATQSWYIHPPLDNRHGNLRPSNNHTLLISEAFHMGIDGIQHDPHVKLAMGSRHNFKYNFHELVNFPALKTLVVMISRKETIPEDPNKHIVYKTLNVVKNRYPSFNVPEVEFRFAY